MSLPTRRASAPAFEALVECQVRIPLRDGVRLATDLYFPAQHLLLTVKND